MNQHDDLSDNLDSEEFSNNDIPSEMEDRLIRFRPRYPKLDIEAIAKIADHESASKLIAVSRSDRSRKLSASQLVGTVAASWVCGAVVGATCIFLLTTGQGQTTQNRDGIVSIDSTPPNTVESTASATKPASESDAISTDFWQFDLDKETLQVGMSLPTRGMLVRASDYSGDRLASRTKMGSTSQKTMTEVDASFESDSIDRSFTPARPMTNAELLKELTGDKGFRIH
jgi:hypothetical protein